MSRQQTIMDSPAWQKMRLMTGWPASTDPAEDFAAELSALTGLEITVATDWIQRLIAESLASETETPGPEPANHFDRQIYFLARHLTQPVRIPHMTRRLDVVEGFLRGKLQGMEVLDYGGGGGKDSIFYAMSGAQVTYCDLLGSLTEQVRRRFELRSLEIPIVDVRDLPEGRVDLINCMDVIEHVYDVASVVADVVSRLRTGGMLACWPAFTTDWTGDHLEKNVAYKEYFVSMLLSIGCTLVVRSDSLMVFRRELPAVTAQSKERIVLTEKLNRWARRRSAVSILTATLALPFYLLLSAIPFIGNASRTAVLDAGLGRMADNVSVWRLSNQRLQPRGGERLGRFGTVFSLAHQFFWLEGRRFKVKRFFEIRRSRDVGD